MAEADGEGTPPLTSLREYKLLGRSGLCVSPLCYGTMNIADGSMTDLESTRKLIEYYIAKGGNFFDTANVYERGKSEELLGKILGQRRSEVVIATKYSGATTRGDPNSGGNSRVCLAKSLDASLKRLGVGHIDLLYVHVWNYRTPVEEVMRSLDDAVRSGKVHYVAVSDTPAWKVAQANTLASLRGWSPFVALQTQYNLIERSAERDLVPMCREMELGMVNWGPLAQGMLTGKYDHLSVEAGRELLTGALARAEDRSAQRAAMDGVDTFRPKAVLNVWNERNRSISLEVSRVAKELNRTATQVALNWNLMKPGTTAPIFAVRTQKQLDDVLGSLDFTLSASQLQRLDEVSKIEQSFPQRWGDGGTLTLGGCAVERRKGTFMSPI